MWNQFIQATCLPNTCGCEFISLEDWIRQPANFWSSLVYIFLGVILFKHSSSFYQKVWSLLCVILGLSSHLAHASFTELAMSADFASIISLMVFPVLIHFGLKRKKIINVGLVFGTYVMIFLIMFHLGKIPKIALSLGTFAVVLFYHFKYLASQLHLPLFRWSLIFLAVGFVFFVLDEFKTFCLPHSMLQLHALWHLFTAFSLYLYGRWIFQSGKW